MRYWLMKSEPSTFSLDDLCARHTEPWDGVRNYQARNFMRDSMQPGDLALFYHSNCRTPGIAGIATISSAAYPDATATDPQHVHYDPTSRPDQPRWFLVDVSFKRKFKQLITLEQLKQQQVLANMLILRKGNRLSITPVTTEEWDAILALANSHA